jgi:hypothetical protein
LTAGEWSDLKNWQFWRDLLEGTDQEQGRWHLMAKRWGIETTGRIPVEVRHGGRPISDIVVELRDRHDRVHWVARTDIRGRAELFSQSPSMDQSHLEIVVKASPNPVSVNMTGSHGVETPIRIALEKGAMGPEVSHGLDLMFMVDTTGSMADELQYLKSELQSVVAEVAKSNGKALDIRTSVNFYRDRNDTYTVRPFPFSRDIKSVIKQIQS